MCPKETPTRLSNIYWYNYREFKSAGIYSNPWHKEKQKAEYETVKQAWADAVNSIHQDS